MLYRDSCSLTQASDAGWERWLRCWVTAVVLYKLFDYITLHLGLSQRVSVKHQNFAFFLIIRLWTSETLLRVLRNYKDAMPKSKLNTKQTELGLGLYLTQRSCYSYTKSYAYTEGLTKTEMLAEKAGIWLRQQNVVCNSVKNILLQILGYKL